MSSDLQPATASSDEQQRATITPPIATQQDLESSFLSQNLDHDTSISSVENGEKHPKARRKRTTAKDKMILEEAYSRNPKPDKQARLEIVERVSLNEKEVQIWFQNRRQNDRRKSRPLSPQEIAALRYNGSQNVGESFIPQVMNGAPELAVFSVSDTSAPPPLLAAVPSTSPSQIAPNPSSLPPNIPETPVAPVPPRALPEATPPQLQNQEVSFSSSQESLPASQSFSSSVGYLANRWNIGSSFTSTPPSHGSGVEETPKSENYTPSSSSPHTSQSGSQPRSHVRLSLSLEGKAELVSNDASPSRQPPPRPSSTIDILPQPRPRSLQRSHSAMPSITLPPISALTNSLPPPRLHRGRSRDVHAWESCADADTHDQLTEQAEHESTGSAIAAITLLRSSSGVLQSSGTKRNASLSRSTQRPQQAKRAKLGRASSSIARLENVVNSSDKLKNDTDDCGKVKVSMLVSPTDSDKENWSPDEDGNSDSYRQRRPLPSGAPPIKSQNARRLGRILEGAKGPTLLGVDRHHFSPAPRRGGRGVVEIFEDSRDPDVRKPNEPDVEKFMRGDVSPSKKGDMDCVAGLLSLSQGAWR
ncbi:unnamed protein product [Clonostachys solani]|uniref:Homeobox domain-containing protein n=1 Tax=Clonostachys solani TaxID=160281 RepID=A0A9P0EJH6_9HYPO|nr:unnamed protein product [Clonostachys solani]